MEIVAKAWKQGNSTIITIPKYTVKALEIKSGDLILIQIMGVKNGSKTNNIRTTKKSPEETI